MSSSRIDIVPDTSPSLIRRVQAGDGEAWSRFVRIYSPLIYSKCRSKNLSADISADILQDVFLRVHKSIGKFAPQKQKGSFRSWLRTIAGNVLVDHFRTLKDRHRELDAATLTMQLNSLSTAMLTDESDDNVSANEPSDEQVTMAQAMELVRNEFEASTWRAFWRFGVDGVPAKRVAEELGLSEGAVRQAKFAVKKRLKTELDGLV